MKFATTESFDNDYRRLKPEHKRQFRQVVATKFAPACDEWARSAEAGKPYIWPSSLRVAEMTGAHGIREMTWSFASPDGRATFQLMGRGGGWQCLWRRVGDHSVFRNP